MVELYKPEVRGSNPRCVMSLSKSKKSVTIVPYIIMICYDNCGRLLALAYVRFLLET